MSMRCLCAMPVRNNKIHHAYLLCVQCLWHWSKDKHPGNPSVLVTQNNFLQDHSDICLCVYISYYHCRGGGHWVVWDNKMPSSATTLSRRPSDWRLLRLQTKSPVRTRTRMKSGACQHDHNFSMSAPPCINNQRNMSLQASHQTLSKSKICQTFLQTWRVATMQTWLFTICFMIFAILHLHRSIATAQLVGAIEIVRLVAWS